MMYHEDCFHTNLATHFSIKNTVQLIILLLTDICISFITLFMYLFLIDFPMLTYVSL